MRFAELFAGAGGLSLGLEQAGHQCVWHAEIEPHACAVLRHHWPDVPLYGDVGQLDGRALVAKHGPIDLLSGGSPCQDLSVAGKRAGLEGGRSGLFYQQARLWRETEAPLLLWENVPGALSSNDGNDFALILEELSGTSCARPNDGWPTAGVVHGPDGRARVAYRVLDLQWFGPPQRRRRVFLLAVRADQVHRYDPAALLFADAAGRGAGTGDAPEVSTVRESLRGDTAASGTAGEGTAEAVGFGATGRSRYRESDVAIGFNWQNGGGYGDANDGLAITHDGTGPLSQSQVPAVALSWWDGREVAPTLSPGAHNGAPGLNGQDQAQFAEAVFTAQLVPRRLTPTECERLMGWPDGHTATGTRDGGTSYALSDSARYRLCGNGVGSPCTRWIGAALP